MPFMYFMSYDTYIKAVQNVVKLFLQTFKLQSYAIRVFLHFPTFAMTNFL